LSKPVFLLGLTMAIFCGAAWPSPEEVDIPPDVLPDLIALDVSGDARGGRDAYLDLDVGMVGGARFMATLGSSRFDSTKSDNTKRVVVTRTRIIGIRSNPLNTVGAGLEFENWGEEGSLIVRSWRVLLDVNTEHWFAAVRRQRREYTLYFRSGCRLCPATVTGRSASMTLELGYYSDGPWAVNLGYTRHDYDFNVRRVTSELQRESFSAATRDLASGFEDTRRSITVSYATEQSLWSVTQIKSISKVDGAETQFITLRASFSLDAHWRLNARLGRQRLAGSNQGVTFIGSGVAYSW